MIFLNSEQQKRLKGQPKKAPNFSANLQTPPQNNATSYAVVGAVLGAAAGYAGFCYSYDGLHAIDPHMTHYSALPLANKAVLLDTLSVFKSLNPANLIKTQAFPPLSFAYGTAISSILGALATAWGGWKIGYLQPEKHISGMPLVPASKIPGLPRGEKPGIWLGPVQLSLREEREGILAIGAQGSGKTTVINSICDQAISRNDNICLIDFKGDYYKRYGESAYYIAPWLESSSRWQLGKDIKGLGAQMTFAQAFCPAQQDSDGKMWAEVAQQLIVAFCKKLENERGDKWGWIELAREFHALSKSAQEISIILSPFRKNIGERIEKMAAETRESILLNMISPAQLVLDIAELEEKLKKPKFWSISDWLKGTKPFCILAYDDSQDELCKRLIVPLFTMITQRLVSPGQPEQSVDGEKYWIIADEAGQLGRLPNLIKMLTATRSKGGRPVLGFQHVSQIKELYGDNFSVVLSAKTLLLGRQSEANEQDAAAKQAGTRTIERYSSQKNPDGGISQSWQTHNNEFVYKPEAFEKLGAERNGVKFLFCGRGVRSELRFFFSQ